MKAKRPSVGHPDPVIPEIEPFAEPVEPKIALVDSVKVVVAVEAPGVTLAGEKEAMHLSGSPEQSKLTAESNEPYWAPT